MWDNPFTHSNGNMHKNCLKGLDSDENQEETAVEVTHERNNWLWVEF